MQKPKSKFIREKIRNLKLNKQNKDYIDHLISIEEFILNGGPHSMMGSWHYHNLKSQYKKEWEAIYKELKPEKFVEVIKIDRKEQMSTKREEAKIRCEEKKENDEYKNMWKSIGGKV